MPSKVRFPVCLCLACSASLPPRKPECDVFYTQCCSRPICPSCIAANPRLSRYNPCLHCLAGVKAVNASGASSSSSAADRHRVNVDGSIRDEDVFVVEDESDDSESEGSSLADENGDSVQGVLPQEPPLSHGVEVSSLQQTSSNGTHQPKTPDGANTGFTDLPHAPGDAASTSSSQTGSLSEVQCIPGAPPKYYIRPDDTLMGISLKLGVDSRILCRMNNLPPSTLRTTPHLLHTRAFLLLPPSARPPPPPTPEQHALDAQHALERAETRFQALTKETDRAVARAYVALAGLLAADDAVAAKEAERSEKENVLRKRRVLGQGTSGGASEGDLEGRATDQYFDDEDWEVRERAEGRTVSILSFPHMQADGRRTGERSEKESKTWWRWRS